MKNERKQRSSQELIQIAQTQLQNRILRAARKDAMKDPAFAVTVDLMNTHKSNIREAKKLLGTGPQSAKVRIQKHQDWIAKITKLVSQAESSLADSEAALADCESQLASAIQESAELPSMEASE